MRELKSSDKNLLVMADAMGGGEVGFFYRTPTTADRVAFVKSQTKRSGNVITSRIAEARLESGFSILTGIRKGDFAYDGGVISSTPGEEGYRADWKELVYQTASDLLMVLGQQIFEGEQKLPDSIVFSDDTPAIEGLPVASAVAAEMAAPAEAVGDAAAAGGDAGETAPLTSSQTSAS